MTQFIIDGSVAGSDPYTISATVTATLDTSNSFGNYIINSITGISEGLPITGRDPPTGSSDFIKIVSGTPEIINLGYDVNSGVISGTFALFADSSANQMNNSTNLYDEEDNLGGANGSNTAFPLSVTEIVCFAAGTRIITENGCVAVENLRAGDFVLTTSRTLRPITWIGHRTIDTRRYADTSGVMPVCIAAHAFGNNRPTRSLYVSPGHAICVDVDGEVLIPAGALVNGSTIRRVNVDEITYWHVELDCHDVLLAENLPCESYLEMGNRSFFAGAEVLALRGSPDASRATHTDFCRPFVAVGPIVDAVMVRLRLRAAELVECQRIAV